MKKFLETTLLLLALTATTFTVSAEEIISKREAKIEAKIKALSAELDIERGKRGASRSDMDRAEAQRVQDSIAATERLKAREEAAARSRVTDHTIEFNTQELDSLLNAWNEHESKVFFDNFFNQYIALDAEPQSKLSKSEVDSLYQDRLRALASPIELPYNAIVRSYIDTYTNPRTTPMKYLVGRAKYYMPSIEEHLIKAGLPIELRAMPIIESALTITAVSHTGAAGLWQFMPATAIHYDLEVNSLVDERCDPVKSTVAACRFLTDLYNIYKDWGLAIAAYNCGAGNVNKAIARSGLKKGKFWDIYDFLPRETRGYVPAFIGASYAYAYHKEHGITPNEASLPITTDTINITRITHFGQVAEVLDIPVEMLRKLNPQYKRDIIPATNKSYSLRLPQRYVTSYIENEKAINALDSTYLKEYINPANIDKMRQPTRVHIVRSGDTLSGIAARYRTTTRQLIQKNNLRNADRLSLGQKIIVN